MLVDMKDTHITWAGVTSDPVRLETFSATSLTSGRVTSRGTLNMLLPKACQTSVQITRYSVYVHKTYRVGGDVDVLLLGVGDELLAGKERVTLDLVDSGGDARGLDDSFELEGTQVLAWGKMRRENIEYSLRQYLHAGR